MLRSTCSTGLDQAFVVVFLTLEQSLKRNVLRSTCATGLGQAFVVARPRYWSVSPSLPLVCFGQLLRYSMQIYKCIVNIIKVYIERNNLQVELIRDPIP